MVVVVGVAAVVPHRNLAEGPSESPIPLLQGTHAVCLLPLPVPVDTTSILESAGGTYLKPEKNVGCKIRFRFEDKSKFPSERSSEPFYLDYLYLVN